MPYNIPEDEDDLLLNNPQAAPTQPPVQENIPVPGASTLPTPSLAIPQPTQANPQATQATPQTPPPVYQPPRDPKDLFTGESWGIPEELDRGFLGDAATALGRGVGSAIESTGAGLETLGAGTTGKFWKEQGRDMAESDLLRPDDAEVAGTDGAVKRSFLSALESFPSSMLPFITGGLGAAVGSLAGPSGALYGGYTGATIGGVAGGAAGLATVFGAGTYGLEKERYLKEAADPKLSKEQNEEDAHDFALSQSLWEVIPEAFSDTVAAGTFGVSKLLLSGLGATGAAVTLKGLLSQGPKAFAQQFGKAYLKSMPVEALSEMVTYWGQATGMKDAGIGDGPIAEGFIDAAATSAWLTLGMGGGMHAYSQQARNRITKAIQSNNPVMRGRAADRVQEGIAKEYGEERAQEWRDAAEKTFAAGGTIDMSSPIFGAVQEAELANADAANVEPQGVMARALGATDSAVPGPIDAVEDKIPSTAKEAAGVFSNTPLTEGQVKAERRADVREAFADYGQNAQQEAEFQSKSGKEVSSALPVMMRDLASAEAGKRIKAPEAAESPYSSEAGKVIRQPSSFPAWVTSSKIISKAGKKNIEKVVTKAMSGKERSFTPRQAELWGKIKSAAKEEYNTNPELLSGQEADKLAAEGFELGATEDISVGSLNPGDEVVVTDTAGVPDKLVHKGFDNDGNAILKDGVTVKVDPFEQISIIGKKIGPEGDAVSQRMIDFVTNINYENSPAVIRRLIKDFPGMLAADKSLSPYADMVKGSLERRLAELEPVKEKVAEKKKVDKKVDKIEKKDKLSERAKKREKEKESPKTKEKPKQNTIRPEQKALKDLGVGMSKAARVDVAKSIKTGKADRLTLRRPEAVTAALKNDKYNVIKNADGSVTIVGVETDGEWVGVAPGESNEKARGSSLPVEKLADIPKTLYHGTAIDFKGQPTGKYSSGLVFYTDNRASANQYAITGGSDGASAAVRDAFDAGKLAKGIPPIVNEDGYVFAYEEKSDSYIPFGEMEDNLPVAIDPGDFPSYVSPVSMREVRKGGFSDVAIGARTIEYTPNPDSKILDSTTKEGFIYLKNKAKGIDKEIYEHMERSGRFSWELNKNIFASFRKIGELYKSVSNDGYDGIYFKDINHYTWGFFDKSSFSEKGNNQSPYVKEYKSAISATGDTDSIQKGKIKVTSVGETTNSLTKIASEWLSLLPAVNGNVNIKVLTRSEVIANINNKETIPAKLKRKLDDDPERLFKASKSRGWQWRDSSDGSHFIMVDDVSSSLLRSARLSKAKQLALLAHEVGHVIEMEFFSNSNQGVKDKIFDSYNKWLKENKEDISTGKQLAGKRLPLLLAMGTKLDATFNADSSTLSDNKVTDYLLSFEEWFANETAKALTSSEKSIGIVGKFFADLADVMRKLAKKIAGTSFMPDAAVANFILGGDMILDDKVAAAEGNKPADTDSINLLYDPPGPMSQRVKDMLDEAKAGPSEEKYVRRFEGKGNETSARYASRQTKAMIRDAGNTVDKFLGAISSRIEKWSPEVSKALRRMDIDIMKDIHDYTAAVEPLMESAKEKMSPRDYSDWGLARYDSDKKKIDDLVEKYSLESEYKDARATIERMGQLLTDAGFDIGNIEEYWPRVVKDTPGLLRHMERGDMRPVFSDALKAKAKQLGIKVSALTDEDRAKVASSVILGRGYGLSGPGSSKERVFESIPEELVQYYFDPDAAMIAHIGSVVETAAYRKFFGKTVEKMGVVRKRLDKVEKKLTGKDISAEDRAELEDVGTELRQILARNEQGDFTRPVGVLVAELEAQGLGPEGQKEIRDTLMARFHERGTSGAVRAYKNLSHINTMGSYASALTQIGDFASPMYNAGMFETGRALGRAITGKQRISAKELGADDIAEEFTDSGKIGAAVNKIFKLTGLSYMNRVARDTFLNSAFEQFKKEAIADPVKLKAKIKPMFLKETDSVIQDLLNDDVTDNVRLLVFDRLLDFQPITKSEMPEKYLTAGNGRLFYSLKSYTIKQFDIYRREIVTGLKSDSKQERVQALKNMARLGMFLVLANASADELKDFMLGRESTLSDRVVDNILRLGGISRFVTWQARREGIGSAAAKQILPPFKLLDALTRDVYSFGDDKGFKSLDSVPLVGKLAYWRLGQGAEKKHDIWEIRYQKQKQRINKFNNRMERSKDKKKFISDNRDDFALSLRIRKFQGQLNRNQKKINKLESLEPSKAIHSRIDLLKDARSEMTKNFLDKI